jgi:hypothetical protein
MSVSGSLASLYPADVPPVCARISRNKARLRAIAYPDERCNCRVREQTWLP